MRLLHYLSGWYLRANILQYLFFSCIDSNKNLQRPQSFRTWHCIDSYLIPSMCNNICLLIWFRTVLHTWINITSRHIIIICIIFYIITIIIIFSLKNSTLSRYPFIFVRRVQFVSSLTFPTHLDALSFLLDWGIAHFVLSTKVSFRVMKYLPLFRLPSVSEAIIIGWRSSWSIRATRSMSNNWRALHKSSFFRCYWIFFWCVHCLYLLLLTSS